MSEPRDIVDRIESGAVLDDGNDERFSGYAVIGQPFESGHVLALRRFPASSIGPACTSVWHRDDNGTWTFYLDVGPELGRSRYFGSEIDENKVRPIDITWSSPRDFSVKIAGERRLEWNITLRPTTATRFVNAAGSLMPNSWWKSPNAVSLMGTAADAALGGGTLRLTGRLPNGQTYIASPRVVWLVSESRAIVDGVGLGRPGPLQEQARLGDLLIPQRGIFAVTSAYIERVDPVRHLTATPKAVRA